MKTSDTIAALAAALAQAQGEMPNAVLNKTNPHYKSQYADLASIRDATLPSLTKFGLSIVQVPTITAVGFVLLSRLIHKSGEWIEADYPIGEGTPQARGSALTYARRYSWSSLTGIASEEDDDGEVAEASEKRPRNSVTEAALGSDTLWKAKTKPIYETLIKEMRVITDRIALRNWGLMNADRIHTMHAEFQKWLLSEYSDHLTAIAEGVTEDGKTVGEVIDDAVPDEAGGSAA